MRKSAMSDKYNPDRYEAWRKLNQNDLISLDKIVEAYLERIAILEGENQRLRDALEKVSGYWERNNYPLPENQAKAMGIVARNALKEAPDELEECTCNWKGDPLPSRYGKCLSCGGEVDDGYKEAPNDTNES